MSKILRTTQGRAVRLGKEIGGGGEGKVYELVGDSTRLVKVWHQDRLESERIAKVSRMCRLDVSLHIRGNPVLAWPEDLVLEHGEGVGYMMPKVSNHFTLFDCLTPLRRRNNNLPIRSEDTPTVASRIASIFAALHDNRSYVGDINPQNILIRRDSLVPTIIDCDSFQIHDPEFPDTPFLSLVVTPGYGAPGRSQLDEPIDASIDVFGLAVIVYQLLLGEHPFVGIDRVDHVPALDNRISDGRFAHARSTKWRPRTEEIANSWNRLPPAVRQVLQRALDYRQFGRNRPTARSLGEVITKHQSQLSELLRRSESLRSSAQNQYGQRSNSRQTETQKTAPRIRADTKFTGT